MFRSNRASRSINHSRELTLKRTRANPRTKMWLTSIKTSHSMSLRARRVIPWEATSLLLFFHPGSFTRKPTKFDLRALILFIWGRKWGAELGQEQLAWSTTETQRLGNHLAHTKSAFLTARRVYFVIGLLFCVLVQLRYGRMWARDKKSEEEEDVGGGNDKNHNTGTWPFCEL